jgi:hypothetical protein
MRRTLKAALSIVAVTGLLALGASRAEAHHGGFGGGHHGGFGGGFGGGYGSGPHWGNRGGYYPRPGFPTVPYLPYGGYNGYPGPFPTSYPYPQGPFGGGYGAYGGGYGGGCR